MAGKTWERTRFPGIYRNEGPRGVRYKVVFGDSEGQQRTKNFRSLKEAKAFQGDIRLKKSQSVRIDPAPGRVNVEEFWKHFLKDSGHPPKHASAVRDSRTSLHPAALGKKQLQSVTRADIKVTLADIRAVGKSAATLHAVRRLVHRLFTVAVEEDRVPRNPVSGVETEKVEPREPRFLTQEEVRRIAGEVSGPIPGARALSRVRRPANR